jgi:hypothetical protein
MNSAERKQLLEKYAKEVAIFREFCILHGSKQSFEEVDFHNFSMGFFIALGVGKDGNVLNSTDPDDEFFDPHVLSTICRYDFQYWEGEEL